MVYWLLFWSFLKVGFLGFGGGLAVISLIQNEVLSHGWLTQTEFVDIVAVSQMTPGPVGLNCATYTGYMATGTIAGSLLASFAIILPSLIIMLTVCFIYDRIRDRWQNNKVFKIVMRIIRIAVICVIAHAAYTLMTPASFIDYRSWIIFSVALVICCIPIFVPKRYRWAQALDHPMLCILAAGLVGYLLYV